jgi:hypothetical protein
MDIEDMPVKLVLILISALFAAALVPTIITEWQDVNTDAWNFTGSTGAATLWDAAPFVLIGGILLAFVLGLIVYRKKQGGF